MRSFTSRGLSRRHVLRLGAAVAVGAAGIASRTRPAAAGFADVPLLPIDFEVERAGGAIGSHEIRFSRRGDRLEVRMRINIVVRVLGVTLYAYRHDSVEVWAGDRLQAYDSDATEDDAHFIVAGRAVANGFEIRSKKERTIAPADIMVASYWTPEICRRTLLIEPKRGRLRTQRVLGNQPASIDVGGVLRPATEYRVAEILDGTCTYEASGRWVGARFDKRGSEIVYRLSA